MVNASADLPNRGNGNIEISRDTHCEPRCAQLRHMSDHGAIEKPPPSCFSFFVSSLFFYSSVSESTRFRGGTRKKVIVINDPTRRGGERFVLRSGALWHRKKGRPHIETNWSRHKRHHQTASSSGTFGTARSRSIIT